VRSPIVARVLDQSLERSSLRSSTLLYGLGLGILCRNPVDVTNCTEGGNMPSRCRHESRVPPTAFSLYSAGRFGSLAELWAKAAGEAVLGAVDFTLGSYLSYAMRARRSASYALIWKGSVRWR